MISTKNSFIERNNNGIYTMLFRSLNNPLSIDEQFNNQDINIKIQELDDIGFPKQVRFTFNKPLEDKNWLWLQWKNNRLIRYQPPAVGASHYIK